LKGTENISIKKGELTFLPRMGWHPIHSCPVHPSERTFFLPVNKKQDVKFH